MLDYEWGNPSNIMFTDDDDDESNQNSTGNPQMLEHYSQTFNQNFLNPNHTSSFHNPQNTPHHFNHHPQSQPSSHFQPFYDPRYGASSFPPPNPTMVSLEPVHSGPTGFVVVPKSEPVGIDYTSRIGLNLGGRTYFSSSEDDFVNRLYRRSRAVEPVNSPRCQAEGCNADLTHAKHYHRRHKVCEFHSKAATVIAAGLTQRFCQQCSRFHLLAEFDNGKRSCRKRLADHNRRRRKTNQTNQHDHNKSHLEIACNSSSENLPKSPPDSGVYSSSSVTIAISPPHISLDSFRQRSYNQAPSSSVSTSSIYFSMGD